MRIIYGNSPITLTEALFVTIVSMTIVFLVLILISSILSLFKYIPSEKEVKKEQPVRIEPVEENKRKLSPEDIKDEKMLAAVTVAVIEAAGENDNAFVRVKSIREVN